MGRPGQSWRWGVVGQVKRSSKKRQGVGGWRLRGTKAQGTGRIQTGTGCARAGDRGQLGPLGSYLAVHNGLLLLQLNLLLPRLRAQESLKDRPFREAALLLQGRLTVWGQGHGGSSGELVPRGLLQLPRSGTTLSAGGTRLSHTQPATDAKIQPYRVEDAQTLGRPSQTLTYTWTHMERYTHSNRIHKKQHRDIHGGDTDRASETARHTKEETPRHSETPRHVEQTPPDPWIHPDTLRKRPLDHQMCPDPWGKTQPDPTIHLDTHGEDPDTPREGRSDGYTRTYIEIQRYRHSWEDSQVDTPIHLDPHRLGYTWMGAEKQPVTLIVLDTFKKRQGQTFCWTSTWTEIHRRRQTRREEVFPDIPEHVGTPRKRQQTP